MRILDRKTCDPFNRYVLPAAIDGSEHRNLMKMALINPLEIPQFAIFLLDFRPNLIIVYLKTGLASVVGFIQYGVVGKVIFE